MYLLSTFDALYQQVINFCLIDAIHKQIYLLNLAKQIVFSHNWIVDKGILAGKKHHATSFSLNGLHFKGSVLRESPIFHYHQIGIYCSIVNRTIRPRSINMQASYQINK